MTSASSPIIISGKYRGKRLKVPPANAKKGGKMSAGAGAEVRPTLTRCKKSLFDVIAAQFPPHHRTEAVFADIFAGCGSVGLEALSIGFGCAYFIENHPKTLQYLHDNIADLKASAQAHIIKSDAFLPPKARRPADILFFDPPYDIAASAWQELLCAYEKHGWIHKNSLIIAQHALKSPPEVPPSYNIADYRTCGKTALTYMRLA